MKANIDRKYLWRLGLIAVVFLAMALWFCYDGAVTYPRQRERALKYQELKEEDRLSEWQEIAGERGWPTVDPGEPKEETDIQAQFVMACVIVLPGLFFAFLFLLARGRWIELDGSELRTSGGRQVEFGQIVTLDKAKWKSKGIAKIHYRQNGRKRRLILDDWKYETDPTRTILREVESSLESNQIVGGEREPEVATESPKADPEPASGE